MTAMSPIHRRRFLQGLVGSAAALGLPRAVAAADRADVYRKIDAQLGESLALLQRWLRQPSVSAQDLGVTACCALTMDLLREAGFGEVKKIPTERHPGIFATLDAGAPRTLGLYFMYDVQPVIESEWSSPPWAAAIVDRPGVGKVVMGRGAENQKGPEAAFLCALRAIRAAGRRLPVNLVLVAEGEEELGSPHLPQIVLRKEVTAALRRTQGLVMPSASQDPDGAVGVALGAKGLVYLERFEASGKRWGRGPQEFEIHSGNKAGVDSPVWRLVSALGTLVSGDGNEPRIDGLLATLRPPSAEQARLLDALAKRWDGEAWKKELIQRWIGDLDKRALLERMETQPTVNIAGLSAGYGGEGQKTILPHRAVAKVDIRLVPDMTAKQAAEAVRAHLARRGYGDIDVRVLSAYDPVQVPLDALPVRAYLSQPSGGGIDPEIWPRSLGSFPGYLFTRPPIERPITRVGLGCGAGAHSRDEYLVLEPAPGKKFQGLAGSIRSYVDYLYAFAAA